MTAAHTPALPTESPGRLLPGTLVLRLMLVAVLAVGLSGVLTAWVMTRASSQEAMRRVVGQQTEEVEVVARLLASKIEQSQKVLRTVAGGITPVTLTSPSSLEWLLQQGLPAVQFFDTMQVARDNGELSLNLRGGRIQDPRLEDGEMGKVGRARGGHGVPHRFEHASAVELLHSWPVPRQSCGNTRVQGHDEHVLQRVSEPGTLLKPT